MRKTPPFCESPARNPVMRILATMADCNCDGCWGSVIASGQDPYEDIAIRRHVVRRLTTFSATRDRK